MGCFLQFQIIGRLSGKRHFRIAHHFIYLPCASDPSAFATRRPSHRSRFETRREPHHREHQDRPLSHSFLLLGRERTLRHLLRHLGRCRDKQRIVRPNKFNGASPEQPCGILPIPNELGEALQGHNSQESRSSSQFLPPWFRQIG
jgi:hypothetical protein